jgi:hypothetical protein
VWIEDGQWPWPHHPITVDGDGVFEVDEAVSALGFQVRPLTVGAAADWCNGVVVMVNGGPAVLLSAGGVAGLGDFVVEDPPAIFTAVAAVDMPHRYRAANP